jgi:hypothetical protein
MQRSIIMDIRRKRKLNWNCSKITVKVLKDWVLGRCMGFEGRILLTKDLPSPQIMATFPGTSVLRCMSKSNTSMVREPGRASFQMMRRSSTGSLPKQVKVLVLFFLSSLIRFSVAILSW